MLKHCKTFKSFGLLAFPILRIRPIITVSNRSFAHATNAGEKRQKGFQDKYKEQTYINPLNYQIKMTSEDILQKMHQQKISSVEVQPNLEWIGYKEGKAITLNTKYKREGSGLIKLDEVHYNQTEIFERDVSILVLQEYLNLIQKNNPQQEPITILNAIGGSGVKAFRMLKELNLNAIKSITTTDTIKTTPEFISINNIINGLNSEQISKHNVVIGDPDIAMFQSTSDSNKDVKNTKYQVIDIHAQGSPLPYIENAIEALEDNGLLCVTLTDIKVLSGPDFEKAFYYYGSTRSKSTVKHEQGIRIALSTINSIANKSNKYITPVLSFFDSFYFRLYMVVNHSKEESKKSVVKTGNVCVCSKCPNYTILPLGKEIISPDGKKTYIPNQIPAGTENCEICESPNLLDGPIWISPINDYEFVKRMYLNLSSLPELEAQTQFLTFKKLSGLLFNIVKEKDFGNNPLALSFIRIASFLDMKTLPNKGFIKNAFRNKGYGAVRSYIYHDLWKSNADMRVAFDFMKVWRKRVLSPKDYFGEFSPESPQYKALEKPIKHFQNFGEGIDFQKESEAVETDKDSDSLFDKVEEMPQFFKNPSREWGPTKLPKKIRGE